MSVAGPGAIFEVLAQQLMVDTLGPRRRTHVDGEITCSLVDRGQGGPLDRVCAVATTSTPSHGWATNAAQPRTATPACVMEGERGTSLANGLMSEWVHY